MALDNKLVAGVGAGTGTAPAIFTCSSEDNIAAVTANEYFNGLLGALELTDFVFTVTSNGGAGVLRLQVVEFLSTGSIPDSKAPLYGAYIGDKRATDTAGLNLDNFGVNVGGSVQRVFTYRNNANTLAEINADSYFNDASFLEVGDLLLLVGSDGANISRVTGMGDITTEAITFA